MAKDKNRDHEILDEVLANFFISNDPTDVENMDKNIITNIMKEISNDLDKEYPEVETDPDLVERQEAYGGRAIDTGEKED